jgi:hypothetical protein
MRRQVAIGTDWRDGDAYASLSLADRSIIAWEWLRRDPAYQADFWRAMKGSGRTGESKLPERWGLHAFEPPALAAPAARPVWSAACHPYVLPVRAGAGPDREDAFDLRIISDLARLIEVVGGGEHLLLSDGLRSIRLDITEGTLGEGPARLSYLVAGIASAKRPLATLRRFLAFCASGCFSGSLRTRDPRAARWVLMLRAHDALAEGADQREIAAILLNRSAAEARWRSREPSLRSRVQRLVRGARIMASGGYRQLLR